MATLPHGFTPRVHPIQVCRKCAVRFESVCAKMSFFDTSAKCFRAGFIVGKLLIYRNEAPRAEFIDK